MQDTTPDTSTVSSPDASLAVSSIARIHTERAQSYLSQLCKHFRHKAPVELDGNHGRIAFGAGVCKLASDDPRMLIIETFASDHAQLTNLEDVIERHLKRFAFHEELSVRWIRQV